MTDGISMASEGDVVGGIKIKRIGGR